MHSRTVTLVSRGRQYKAGLTVADKRPLCVLTVTLDAHAVILAFVNVCDTHKVAVCSLAFYLFLFNLIV